MGEQYQRIHPACGYEMDRPSGSREGVKENTPGVVSGTIGSVGALRLYFQVPPRMVPGAGLTVSGMAHIALFPLCTSTKAHLRYVPDNRAGKSVLQQ